MADAHPVPLGRRAALALAAGILASGTALAQDLEIHNINVQQGTSILVIGPDGTTVLLDAGKNGKGTSEVVPYLQGIGIQPAAGLDYTIGSHLDADHVGGMDDVIAAGYDVTVANWFNGSSKTNTTINDYLAACAATTAGAATKAPLGQVVQLGNGATLTIVAVDGEVLGFGPVTGAQNNENDMSIAVLIEYGDFDYIWAGDLGGGDDDGACTGRSTGQVNVETPLAQALTPGGGFPLLSAEGVDVMHINHHGSESSTNSDYMGLLKPEVAVISVGAGQSSTWHHPRADVVDQVLLSQAACVAVPSALVLQTEEGSPTGSNTSFSGYCVGDVVITTDGFTDYFVSATGAVSQGPDERAAAGLPASFALDEDSGPPPPPPSGEPWINEFHYDNASSDVGEMVEIAGPAGTDLTGWQVLGYNGNGGSVYDTVVLSGVLPDQGGCVGTLSFAFPGMQNGSPDGLALVDDTGAVVEFLSYEGVITASSGAAAGLTSTDVGVAESGSTPAGHSLQLGGTGSARADFAWQSAQADTPGLPNAGQTFSGGCSGGPTPPAPPTGLTAGAGDGSVTLGWDANGEPDLDGYNVYRGTAAGGPYTQLNASLVTATSYGDTGLQNGTTYYYVVSAVNTSAQESAPSAEGERHAPGHHAPGRAHRARRRGR